MMTFSRYSCKAEHARKIGDWFLFNGGISVWRSVNLANPSQTWTTPRYDRDGKPTTKPNWQCGNVPERDIIDPAMVDVITTVELERFHVATRMGGTGLTLKVTDGGSRRLRSRVEHWEERRAGKAVWHEFDYYDYKNCVIVGEDGRLALPEWLEKNKQTV